MSLKDKLVNINIPHPRIVTFGIGLVVTFSIAVIIGMINDPNHSVDARQAITQGQSSNQGGGQIGSSQGDQQGIFNGNNVKSGNNARLSQDQTNSGNNARLQLNDGNIAAGQQ